MLTIFLIIIILLSFAGTFLITRVAVKKNLMDIPNIRSSHSQPTPRGGGLPMVLSWYVGLIGLKYFGLIESNLFLALISGSILAIVSFLDDIYNLKPWIRIVFQLITVILGLYFIGGFKTIYLNNIVFKYPVLFTCIAILGIMWFVNLYNFLDGIDGYASVEAISVALGMFLLSKNPVLLVLVFAILGFLVWNWPKAKIFMGDIGSTQLGYILIILGIYFNNYIKINFIGWLILTSLFWVDASLTLYRRWRNKEKLSQAHKKHYYQRIVQYGFTHKKTVVGSIVINLFFIVLVYMSEKESITYFITFPLCLIINLTLAKLIDASFPFKSTN